MNCCLTSQPCLNGGTCQPVLPPTSEKRFNCACPDGYQGELCQYLMIKSCRGYVNRSRIPGNYTIIDNQNKTLLVFCDFDKTTSMTWTLVQSYELSKTSYFGTKPSLKITLLTTQHRRGRSIVFQKIKWDPSNKTPQNGALPVAMTRKVLTT